MPQPPDEDLTHEPRPSLTIDWEVYAAMLEESDMPLEKQRELIETLWSIVVMFVDLGFDVHPTRQICGEDADDPDGLIEDVVSYMNKNTEHKRKKER